MQKIDLLICLAEKATMFGETEITTGGLSAELNTSQQSISNALKDLENKDMIFRKASYSGITISLAERGRSVLHSYNKRLNSILKTKKQIKGRVFSGVGEGRFYTEYPLIKRKFIELLGIDPYPGTLNIRCRENEKNKFLFDKKPVYIKGFKTKERTFGGVICYKVRVQGISAAITIPERTVHKAGTVELISNRDLRKSLKVKNGDEVRVTW